MSKDADPDLTEEQLQALRDLVQETLAQDPAGNRANPTRP